jgi:hypothetical protein
MREKEKLDQMVCYVFIYAILLSMVSSGLGPGAVAQLLLQLYECDSGHKLVFAVMTCDPGIMLTFWA